ncbi:alpha-ketoglutarate-dependent dioxygenase AlkB family protein [Belliella aquatica]|uniref:Alkylated DNA repair protein n=1 Tax=Belliella aquatica TaxID=1323734 RepID=A0ABQ1M8T7_9BACT|nr:alpha-ketoglutarate-dependent dioxygenase AlkB [Belliella aquatica]MCH7404675.1 alpha-ketoglutarate-dependent dioxygenase AlkB [Belliella aquatica]GGC35001.1 alkylated DNA repair protein [Belliella aquatica]
MQNTLFPNEKSSQIINTDGDVTYYPSFFSQEESDQIMSDLIKNIEWKQEPIWMFGKKIMQPRLTALYGDPNVAYGYSGIIMKVYPWNEILQTIKAKVETLSNTDFTHVLLNYYRNGQDSMGWHRDNEKNLGENPTIASVSFGISREFQLRKYETKKDKKSILLTHGSLLMMQGETQHFWEHQIPKSNKIINPRINLTFRKVLG